MDQHEVEIFHKTSTASELRFWSGGETEPRRRLLDRGVVDGLVEAVEAAYGRESAARAVFNARPLLELGGRLFEFLDGDERWLSKLGEPPGAVLRVGGEERFRHLPWELLVKDGAHLAVNPTVAFNPLRVAAKRESVPAGSGAANRPLRVLFMATSPEGVEPVLGFEAEEAEILAATSVGDDQVELVVEESGSLEGLRFLIESYGAGYFDVVHLSGHADVHGGQPVFVIEDDLGMPAFASADDLAGAIGPQWPRLVFLSGCLTGNAPGGGTVPSMSEALVGHGATAVLGWGLPVGDVSATNFAAALYQALAAGATLAGAAATARHVLHHDRSPYWHLLRLYADASPLSAMVTERNHRGRARLDRRRVTASFLDPATETVKVAAREEFVGRRRVIQRCLRTLTQNPNDPEAYQGLVLQGMGGLGKSTLASRLAERLPTYEPVVWVGAVDETEFVGGFAQLSFDRFADGGEVNQVLSDDSQPLAARLRYLFTSGPLRDHRCLFIFDDFEFGNLDDRDGGHVLSAEMSEILPALLGALRDSTSPSRVIITSRYAFPASVGARLWVEGLETFTDVERDKKLANLPNLGPGSVSGVAPVVRARAVEAAADIPRLLEWMDRIVADDSLDLDGLLAAIEAEADKYRKEDIFAERLLGQQPAGLRQMLARVNLAELPIPVETVRAMHPHPEVDGHVRRASALGLLEEGLDPTSGEHRYYVSNVLRPLLADDLTPDQRSEACAAAANSLFEIWIEPHLDATDDDSNDPGPAHPPRP